MIEARGLTKRYRRAVAVAGLSFEVLPGCVTGFLGANGSGKSTTMRMIMGLDAPDAGQATIGGRVYRDLRWPLREVGALLETRAFHPGRRALPATTCYPAAGPGKGRPAGPGHGASKRARRAGGCRGPRSRRVIRVS